MMSSQSQIILPNIHKKELLLSPQQISTLPKTKIFNFSKNNLNKSSQKLKYLFEQNHKSAVPEEQLLKERQMVFQRVHKIIRQKLKKGSMRNTRALLSPRRLRRVLKSQNSGFKGTIYKISNCFLLLDFYLLNNFSLLTIIL